MRIDNAHRKRACQHDRHKKGRPEAAFPSTARRTKPQPFNRFAIAAPRSPGDFTVVTPAFSSAANFPSAVPAPPEAIAPACPMRLPFGALARSEEHTSELQSLMRTSSAVFCLTKKKE